MHAAPPVRVTVGRSVAWAAVVALVWAAAAANVSAWALLRLGATEATAVATALVLSLATAAIAAARSWRSQASGVLHWDGRSWHWCGAACRATVAIDAGSRMLLTIRTGPGRPVWVVTGSTAHRGDRAGLRAALFAHGSGEPDPALWA